MLLKNADKPFETKSTVETPEQQPEFVSDFDPALHEYELHLSDSAMLLYELERERLYEKYGTNRYVSYDKIYEGIRSSFTFEDFKKEHYPEENSNDEDEIEEDYDY